MAKKDSKKSTATIEVVAVHKERIGILYKTFVHAASMGPHTHQCAYQRWNAGQIITKEADIEMLKKLNAPMGVYIRDVDGPAKS